MFAARGSAATYTPPGGPPLTCRAIRQGGGQPVRVGPIVLTTQKISFHVRRSDIAAPTIGAQFDYRGETFTVDAWQPIEGDTEGLLWSLEASWGADLIYRSVSGSGATQNPPQGSGFVVAADASAGDSAISIRAPMAIGRLEAGDKVIIGDVEHVVTGSGVQAVMQQFAAVPILPPLSAAAPAGASVDFRFARDRAIRGAVASYSASEIFGGVKSGDRRIVVMQASLAGIDQPKAGDRIVFEERAFSVINAAAIYAGASVAAWDIQVRG